MTETPKTSASICTSSSAHMTFIQCRRADIGDTLISFCAWVLVISELSLAFDPFNSAMLTGIILD